MAQRIIIPRLGQTMTEGIVAKWHIADGAPVKPGDTVYEMEYDKATAPVEAKSAGVLKHLCKEGDSVPVGQAVAVVLEKGEKLEDVNIAGAHEVANSKYASTSDKKAPGTSEKSAKSIPVPKADKKDSDVIVVGGGPGGYVAALKLAMLGASVILVEKDKLGGTCLNRGCIPTKAILQSAELYEQMKNSAPAMGVSAKEIRLDTKQANSFKQKTVDTLVKGVEGLMKARKVRVIRGAAAFTGPKTLEIKLNEGGTENVSAPNIIIASGSQAAKIPVSGADGKNVITSTEALDIEKLPESLIVIGGGVIGMEIGTAYACFGVKVSVIEALPALLPGMDGEVVKEFTRHAKKMMDIFCDARVSEISDKGGKKLVRFQKGGKAEELQADKVLLAVGRVPDTQGLQLEKAGILAERGRIIADEKCRTNIDGVYCIGDANGKIMLAHAASAQGIMVAEQIMGRESHIAQNIVPACVYTDPEIASVGITEEQAKEKGIQYKIGKFSFRANGRSLVLDKAMGFVKIIGDAKFNEVLGVHIIGPCATELIAECAAVMKLEGCVEDIANTIHAHPTVSEAIMEAAENYLGGAIHSL